MVLKRKFWLFQPMELKAIVTPYESPSDWMLASVSASIWVRPSAVTTTSPAVARMSDRAISAITLDWMTLVAMTAPIAMESPSPPHDWPPEEVTSTSVRARMTAADRAVTSTDAAVRSRSVMAAWVVLRTSLRTRTTPTALESEASMLTPGMMLVSRLGFQ